MCFTLLLVKLLDNMYSSVYIMYSKLLKETHVYVMIRYIFIMQFYIIEIVCNENASTMINNKTISFFYVICIKKISKYFYRHLHLLLGHYLTFVTWPLLICVYTILFQIRLSILKSLFQMLFC